MHCELGPWYSEMDFPLGAAKDNSMYIKTGDWKKEVFKNSWPDKGPVFGLKVVPDLFFLISKPGTGKIFVVQS